MPGALGTLAVLPPEDINVGMQKFEITTQARDAVLQVMPAPGTPFQPHQVDPRLEGFVIGVMTNLDDDALGELLRKAGEWADYVEYQLALFSAEKEGAQAQLEFIQASIRLSLRSDEITGKKYTVAEKTDMMRTDPRVVEAQSKAIRTQAMYELAKSINAKAQRNWDTVSRRITQRGQQIERIKREHNISAVPAAAAQRFHQPQTYNYQPR